MNERIPIGSPVRTMAIVNRYLLRAKRKLGQNFLVDQAALQGIVQAARIKPGDQVIEIGPGIGALTEELLLAGAKVFAYEVDHKLKPILHNELPATIDNVPLALHFKLLFKDILKADFRQDLSGFFDLTKPIKVVANLPYYITTPIIFFLADSDLNFVSLTLMMQKEVADRLQATPGHKEYGPLTIAVQTRLKVKIALQVSRNSFWPRPKVDSSVVILTPLDNKIITGSRQHFNWVVKMCFSQRRKTLNNNLKSLLPEPQKRQALLKKIGLPANTRPEQLSIAQFVQLAQAVPDKGKA